MRIRTFVTKFRHILSSSFFKRRGSDVLVTDILFPSKYAQWRISEISSFIKEFKADVMVFKIDSFAGIHYEVDYVEMRDRQGFLDWNILIFDPKYNYLNKFNKNIDGTKFNGVFPASYLFSRRTDFDLLRYKQVYHIFLTCFFRFNNAVYFPKSNQAIHLYPGGGYSEISNLKGVDKRVKMISTHPKTTNDLECLGYRRVIECLVAPMMEKGDRLATKNIKHKNSPLVVGFASIGKPGEKGAEYFVKFACLFTERHPNMNVRFVSVGREPLSASIEHFPPMSMTELLKFYHGTLDVLINLETGKAFHGWPLGTEAALMGVVLATTDVRNVSGHYAFPEDSIFVFELSKLDDLCRFIADMAADFDLLLARSLSCQKAVELIVNYDSQQARVFKFLDLTPL